MLGGFRLRIAMARRVSEPGQGPETYDMEAMAPECRIIESHAAPDEGKALPRAVWPVPQVYVREELANRVKMPPHAGQGGIQRVVVHVNQY